MSTALAIASVTYVLKDLLNDGMINRDVGTSLAGDVLVTALPPDRVDASATSQQNQLNLFMYQATPNPGWQNRDYPSLDSQGMRIANPPLALDLHYLLTAYSAAELNSEILLGYGMQLFHENPVLIRDAIRASLDPDPNAVSGLPVGLQSLSTSGLADQLEQIKITPEPLTATEIYNLWNAFQAKYRPTAAYRATVVLIQSQKTTQAPLPVRKRKLLVTPFQQPAIATVSSQATPGGRIVANQKILTGYTLVIDGTDLSGNIVTVNVDGFDLLPDSVSDSQVSVVLPADLPAGMHTVQIIQQLALGSPPLPHHGFESNSLTFQLCPVIGAIALTNVPMSGMTAAYLNIGFAVTPAIGAGQTATLFLNQLVPAVLASPPTLAPPVGSPPAAYTFPMAAGPPGSPPGVVSYVNFAAIGVAPGNYLVRIQVAGAESPLGTDANGMFNSPQITIT